MNPNILLLVKCGDARGRCGKRILSVELVDGGPVVVLDSTRYPLAVGADGEWRPTDGDGLVVSRKCRHLKGRGWLPWEWIHDAANSAIASGTRGVALWRREDTLPQPGQRPMFTLERRWWVLDETSSS